MSFQGKKIFVRKPFLLANMIVSMGFRYAVFRAVYEFRRKTGLLKRGYPTKSGDVPTGSFVDWVKGCGARFIFFNRNEIPVCATSKSQLNQIKHSFERTLRGDVQFFNGNWLQLGTDYDWLENPVNGKRYQKDSHWTSIEEFGHDSGDIKYVWEKSRFCYLYAMVKHDLYTGSDSSGFVFSQIDSWIEANRVNCGPHYKCSQEISLRLLNWITMLFFYRGCEALDETMHRTIVQSIYWQTRHVEKNSAFSRITVRNNHAITEALCLFTVGVLFPEFPEARRWVRKGKRFLEEEGRYQFYTDGSYIQHSFNYQRVAFQLYSFALALAKKNGIVFSEALRRRLAAAVEMVAHHQSEQNGMVPNFGANDGSLFFPVTVCEFRDYRPQMNTLHFLLHGRHRYGDGSWRDDSFWFCGLEAATAAHDQNNGSGAEKRDDGLRSRIASYPRGGYYVMSDEKAKSCIKCASFIHRPAHADNLHLDLWFQGNNIACDCGTFSYNGTAEDMAFFGTGAHNTVAIDGSDQMLRGPRFIWFFWSRKRAASLREEAGFLEFKGSINAFRHIRRGIIHERIVRQFSHPTMWTIQDTIKNWSGTMMQTWHLPVFDDPGLEVDASACDGNGDSITVDVREGAVCWTYGQKWPTRTMIFTTRTGRIETTLKLGKR